MKLLFFILLTNLNNIAYSQQIREKDLAVVLDTAMERPIRSNTVLNRDSLMPERWYQSVLRAYLQTPVGDALRDENRYSEWQLVSMRIVPCKPMIRSTRHNPEVNCWPEVRLVLQPIVDRLRTNRGFIENFADDRAVHMLYDVPAQLLGPEAEELSALKTQLASTIANFTGANISAFTTNEQSRFIFLRNKLTSILMNDTIQLRTGNIPDNEYAGHGIRPELLFLNSQESFRSKLVFFLARYSFAANLKAFTSFSLPRGRAPASIDDWIFLAFSPTRSGDITSSNVSIFDMNNGRRLIDLPSATRGTMRRDSDLFYDIDVEDTAFLPLKKQVFLFNTEEYRDAVQNINDPHMIGVNNTSCASCHRLNSPRFNFHNLSKLGNDDVNVSRRVVNDVDYDIEWLIEEFTGSN